MRLKMVRRLVDVNIIYATQPAQLAKFRKKQEMMKIRTPEYYKDFKCIAGA